MPDVVYSLDLFPSSDTVKIRTLSPVSIFIPPLTFTKDIVMASANTQVRSRRKNHPEHIKTEAGRLDFVFSLEP